jgi:hypothetical protein
VKSSQRTIATPGFLQFYREHFLPEHRHRANVVLHVAGTLAGLVFVATVLMTASAWWLLMFPLVHAAPGLLGHRLFERNVQVGDVRVLRRDFGPHWFVLANHLLAFETLTRRGRRPASSVSPSLGVE